MIESNHVVLWNRCLEVIKDNVPETTYNTWLEEKLDITDATVPQTIVYEDGKITTNTTGALSYYRLAQLFK